MPRPNVLILLHERDRRAADMCYWIWPMREIWQEMGLRVDVVRGPRRAGPADLLFPHIDLTVTPPEYVSLFDHYPRVVNRRVIDISKRRISTNLVSPGDSWKGPVIVKTDGNAGGFRDRQLRSSLPRAAARRALALVGLTRSADPHSELNDFASAEVVPPERYPVFGSLHAVPPDVFRNPALVVERFLPERDGELYCVRYFSFLGDCTHAKRKLGPDPVVKGRSGARDVEISPDDGILAARARLGFDYGKLDFVVRDEGVVLLDANRTPCYPAGWPRPVQLELARRLAPGIRHWLDIPG